MLIELAATIKTEFDLPLGSNELHIEDKHSSDDEGSDFDGQFPFGYAVPNKATVADEPEPYAPNQELPKPNPGRKTVDTYESVSRRFTTLLVANKRLYCDICGFNTMYRDSLIKHMTRLHMAGGEAQLKPFCCEFCGIRMSQQGNLKMHMRIHTGEKPYPCLIDGCEKRYSSNSERKEHMRVHTKEKPFKCNQCSAAFGSSSKRKSHQTNIHSDYRKYKCEECGKSFKLLRTYKNHLLTHTNIKPYHCHVCGRDFRQRGAFKVHMNIHTDNRPYKCSLCDMGFHSTAARRSHEKSVHKKE